MAPPAGLVIRPALTDADLEAWNHVRRTTLPDEAIATIEQLRAMTADDGRLFLLAEDRGEVVANGVAAPSSLADGYVAPRVLPEHRRRGIGSLSFMGWNLVRPSRRFYAVLSAPASRPAEISPCARRFTGIISI